VAVDHSVLDALGRVRGTWQPEFVDRIITMFMETALILIAELKKASAENDIPKLHHASHALKSCSATVGAGPLQCKGWGTPQRPAHGHATVRR
jgi:HPt (histidine-containing phosphotransfer) domain-containing protein